MWYVLVMPKFGSAFCWTRTSSQLLFHLTNVLFLQKNHMGHLGPHVWWWPATTVSRIMNATTITICTSCHAHCYTHCCWTMLSVVTEKDINSDTHEKEEVSPPQHSCVLIFPFHQASTVTVEGTTSVTMEYHQNKSPLVHTLSPNPTYPLPNTHQFWTSPQLNSDSNMQTPLCPTTCTWNTCCIHMQHSQNTTHTPILTYFTPEHSYF